MALSNLGIHGSARVAEMFRDAVDGSDSLDILVVGDSNTLFSAGGSSGWTDGLQYGLYANGAPIYATPIFPCALDGSYPAQGWRCSWSNFKDSAFAGIGDNGQTSDGVTTAFLLPGNANGPSAITDQFKVSGSFGPAEAQLGPSTMDYGYYSSTSPRFWDYDAGLFIDADHPMNVSSAFTYRVVHGVFASGGGHFHMAMRDAAGATSALQQVQCVSASDGIATTTLTVSASALRTTKTTFTWGGTVAANRNSGNGVVGKAAFLLQSATKSVKGTAVSAMCWWGGGTATQIATAAIGIGIGTWKTWLREAYERQVQAGGSGRVVIFFHAGANADSNLPASWSNAFDNVIASAKSAWSALGYPSDALGFVGMVSHAKDSTDTLSPIRAHASAAYASSSDALFVDLSQIAPYSKLSAMSWYDNPAGSGGSPTPDPHLWGDGYDQVGSLVVSRIVAFSNGGVADLATIKAALKIDYDEDDATLSLYRSAAISLVERRTEMLLSPQSRIAYLRDWSKAAIPDHPLSSITSITYRDASNAVTTMPVGDYWVDRADGPMACVRFLESPAIYEGTQIEMAYTAGYSEVPPEINHAVIALVGGWYNNPEAFQPIGLSTVPLSVEYILASISTGSRIR